METNKNENTKAQKLGDTAKTVLRGKYIAIQASLKRTEKIKNAVFIFSPQEPGAGTATEGQA